MELPLKGVRVLDIAQVLAGPFGAAMLGDLGADVIKIEPLRGDESRYLGPGSGRAADSAMFVGANRSKRGLALDLACEEGVAVFHRLLKDADIVVDNLRPAAKEKLGVDYPALKAVNPAIIAVNVSAFGNSGPYAGRPGIDPLAQALGGFMDITGERGGAPLKSGAAVVDGTTAHLVVIAALSALRQRDQSGEGQLVEVNLLEGMLNLQPTIVSQLTVSDYIPPRVGCGSDLISPYGCFECADGTYLQLVGLNDKFFVNICAALEREAWVSDSRFSTQAQRLENNAELEALVAQRVLEKSASAWMELLVAHDVMAAPVKSMRESLADPQVQHNGLLQEVDHARLGPLQNATLPVKFGGCGGSNPPVTAAPALGEHSRTVLAEAGLAESEIDTLLAAGVVATADL